jgi:hypothetical protein
MDEKIKELLYRSFDTDLSPEEEEQLGLALRQSEELRIEKDRIAALRDNIASRKKQSFEPFFADRVMGKLYNMGNKKEEDFFFEWLFALFRPVAIAATVLIIIAIGYNIGSTGQISLEGALAVPEVTLGEVYDPTLTFAMEE